MKSNLTPSKANWFKLAATTATLACTLLATNAIAQSNHGNGDGIIYLNHVPTIADPFVKPAHGEVAMPITSEMAQLLSAFQQFLIFRGFNVNAFFINRVFNEKNEYNYVDSLPCTDMEDLKSTDGQPIDDDACTDKQGITLVLKNKFDTLTFTDQGLTLMHERLHAEYPNAAHHWITGFVAGLRKMLEIKAKQANGDRSALSDDDFALISNMYLLAKKIGIPLNYDGRGAGLCSMMKSGGGIFCNVADIDLLNYKLDYFSVVKYGNLLPEDQSQKQVYQSDSLFLGMGAAIKGNFSSQDEFAKNVNHSIVIDSNLSQLTVLKNSTVTDSVVQLSSIESSQVKDSSDIQIHAVDSKIDNCKNLNVWAQGGICSNSESLADVVTLELDSGASVSNLLIEDNNTYSDRKIYVRPNTKVDTLHLFLASPFSSGLTLTFDSPQTPITFDASKTYEIRVKSLGWLSSDEPIFRVSKNKLTFHSAQELENIASVLPTDITPPPSRK